ncbi:hypothetical protein H0H93_011946 [Arthromyces matolae]|nr:hypothetical protein H0H93_011946 [Arthromyces matolae]
MAPKSWATPEQEIFLNEHLARFVEAKLQKKDSRSSKRLTRYTKETIKEFFANWPEETAVVREGRLPQAVADTPRSQWTPVELKIMADAVSKRQKKITNWLRNHSQDALGMKATGARSSNVVLASLIKPPKRQRLHKADEKYQTMFYAEKLRVLVEAEWAKNGISADIEEDEEAEDDDKNDDNPVPASVRSLKMALRRQVVAAAWKAEAPEVKEVVFRALEEEKAEMIKSLDMSKEGLDRDPEQRKLVISNLVSLLENVSHEIHRLCGWCTTVITGGPNPALGNALTVQTVTFGESAESKTSFLGAFPQFNQLVSQPFVGWLRNVFPQHPVAQIDISHPLSSPVTPAPPATSQPDEVRGSESGTSTLAPNFEPPMCTSVPISSDVSSPFAGYLPSSNTSNLSTTFQFSDTSNPSFQWDNPTSFSDNNSFDSATFMPQLLPSNVPAGSSNGFFFPSAMYPTVTASIPNIPCTFIGNPTTALTGTPSEEPTAEPSTFIGSATTTPTGTPSEEPTADVPNQGPQITSIQTPVAPSTGTPSEQPTAPLSPSPSNVPNEGPPIVSIHTPTAPSEQPIVAPSAPSEQPIVAPLAPSPSNVPNEGPPIVSIHTPTAPSEQPIVAPPAPGVTPANTPEPFFPTTRPNAPAILSKAALTVPLKNKETAGGEDKAKRSSKGRGRAAATQNKNNENLPPVMAPQEVIGDEGPFVIQTRSAKRKSLESAQAQSKRRK